MSPAILARSIPIIHAAADPPRDRTSRARKAVTHCQAEWSHAYNQAKETGQPPARCLRMAAVAYKLAMPQLDTLPAIRAAIACIAQGIALEVFDGRDASQLLYSAQVALSLHKARGAKK